MKNYVKLAAVLTLIMFFVPLSAQSIEERLNIVSEADNVSSKPVEQNNSTDITSANSPAVVKKKTKVEIPAPAAEDKIILESAVNYFSNADYYSASLKIDELLAAYPASMYLDQALIIRAKILAKNGDYAGAVAELSKISKESGEYPISLFLRAEIFKNAKDTNSAREMFLKLASMFPANDLADDALINLGDIYLASGSSDKALETATGIIKNYADRETVDDAYFLLGKIFMQDKNLRDLQRARDVYKKFIYMAEVEKAPFFANSPLLRRVKTNYNDLNKFYFSEKN